MLSWIIYQFRIEFWLDSELTNLNQRKNFQEWVFCYHNCSDILWEKFVLVIKKNFWNSRPRICKFLISLERFIQTVRTIFCKVCIIRLDHICFEKSSSTLWQVRAQNKTLFSKRRQRFFFEFCGLLRNPNFNRILL